VCIDISQGVVLSRRRFVKLGDVLYVRLEYGFEFAYCRYWGLRRSKKAGVYSIFLILLLNACDIYLCINFC
jgi:hypothetical protein